MKNDSINRLDSESGIIASLIKNINLYYYGEQLEPKHFTNKQNACVYRAIQMLAQKGIEKVDAFNILEVLNSSEETRKFSEELTLDGLKEMIEFSDLIARDSPEEYKVMVDNVMDAAFRREACTCLEECLNDCKDMEMQDVRQLIYDKIDDVTSEYSDASDMPLYCDVIDDIWAHVKARQRGETNAISFPFPELNKYVVLEPGESVCISAGAKAGKSAMLLTCTVDMLRKNKSVLYVDSEISSELFTIRMLSHISGVKFGVIRSGKFSPEEEEKINQAIGWLKTRKFIHIYMPILKADELYMVAKKAKRLINIDCIVVDYLKADSAKEQAFETYAALGNAADCLKNRIAGELGIAALTAAQATTSGKIADSARIARSMSTVISITDKTVQEMEMDGTGAPKKVRVLFNRNGAQMTENEWIDFCFDGATCKYYQSEIQHENIEPF